MSDQEANENQPDGAEDAPGEEEEEAEKRQSEDVKSDKSEDEKPDQPAKQEDDQDDDNSADKSETESTHKLDVDTKYDEHEESLEEEGDLQKSSSFYLESLYDARLDNQQSIRSVYPPLSWPSTGQLSKDSDVYPQNTEYELTIQKSQHIQSSQGTMLVGDDSRMDLHDMWSTEEEEMEQSPGTDGPESVVEAKTTESVAGKQGSPTKAEVDVEKFKIKDIPYLREVLQLPITPEDAQKISFTETLLISYDLHGEGDEDSKDCPCTPLFHKSPLLDPEGVQEMGGMHLNIESADCALVTFCTTQFSCLGSAGASRILSVVDYNFALIEDKKTEWHCMHEKKVEKSIHVAKEGKEFVAFRTESEDEKSERHRGEVSLNVTGDIVLDGGLFALMRYLIISNFYGEFETWSMHVTGDVCRCKFTVGKKKTIYLNDTPYLTIRIKKECFRDHRYPDVSKSYFLPSGHLVRQRWRGCKYFIHINPAGRIPPKIGPEYCWKDDIMLVSKYLDEKQKRRSEILTCWDDHPEIKSILQDYMLSLLQLKPEHVMEFSIEYFTNLFRD